VSAPSANDLYRAAQRLIKSGQPVFPCHTRPTTVNTRKGPRVFGAKSPMIGGGLNSASADKAQVKAWWSKYGEAAIGIPTGIKYDVLDVDSKGEQDGRVHLTRLAKLGLLDGCKHVVKTPSGGWHLYFRATPGMTNKANPELGLDVRATGGYVLAPPSWIDDGESSVGSYTFEGLTTGGTDEPLMWDLIVRSLTPFNDLTKKPIDLLGYERQGSLASLRGWLAERRTGERNNALHWAVCRCIENGIDPNELVEVALLMGLDETEVETTIDSALRRAEVRAEDLMSEGEALFGRA
jgi:hypothetical protein